MITFCIWKFHDMIKAALTANASAANGEVATMVELIPERRVPLWSLNTAAVAPAECASSNAASTLHLIHPTSGGLQVTLLPVLVALVELFAGSSAVSASFSSICLALRITFIGLGIDF
ncbi:hypothetical protein AHAS_Ahas17G0087500 [Arachis hypogaea]